MKTNIHSYTQIHIGGEAQSQVSRDADSTYLLERSSDSMTGKTIAITSQKGGAGYRE